MNKIEALNQNYKTVPSLFNTFNFTVKKSSFSLVMLGNFCSRVSAEVDRKSLKELTIERDLEQLREMIAMTIEQRDELDDAPLKQHIYKYHIALCSFLTSLGNMDHDGLYEKYAHLEKAEKLLDIARHIMLVDEFYYSDYCNVLN